MTSRLVTAALITLRDGQWSSEHFDVRYVIIGPKTAQLQQFVNIGMHASTHARMHARMHARTDACQWTCLSERTWNSENFDVSYVKIGPKMGKLHQLPLNTHRHPPNSRQCPPLPAKCLLLPTECPPTSWETTGSLAGEAGVWQVTAGVQRVTAGVGRVAAGARWVVAGVWQVAVTVWWAGRYTDRLPGRPAGRL